MWMLRLDDYNIQLTIRNLKPRSLGGSLPPLTVKITVQQALQLMMNINSLINLSKCNTGVRLWSEENVSSNLRTTVVQTQGLSGGGGSLLKRPFLSCPLPLCQNQTLSGTTVSYGNAHPDVHFYANEIHFHNKSFERGLILKQWREEYGNGLLQDLL